MADPQANFQCFFAPQRTRFLLFFASQMARQGGKSSSSNNSASLDFEAKLWLAANKRRALIQMATGSGKTYTAVNFVYRLIKLAGARRVLFLVDRSNLGDQTLKEFQQFVTPDDGRKFTELYNVQHLQSAHLDKVSRVCISTIQRLYSMLRGEEIDPEIDERSGYELRESLWKQPPPVVYNPHVPTAP